MLNCTFIRLKSCVSKWRVNTLNRLFEKPFMRDFSSHTVFEKLKMDSEYNMLTRIYCKESSFNGGLFVCFVKFKAF